MELFKKNGRHYQEVKDSEVLFAARNVLDRIGIKETAALLHGMATLLSAQEDHDEAFLEEISK